MTWVVPKKNSGKANTIRGFLSRMVLDKPQSTIIWPSVGILPHWHKVNEQTASCSPIMPDCLIFLFVQKTGNIQSHWSLRRSRQWYGKRQRVIVKPFSVTTLVSRSSVAFFTRCFRGGNPISSKLMSFAVVWRTPIKAYTCISPKFWSFKIHEKIWKICIWEDIFKRWCRATDNCVIAVAVRAGLKGVLSIAKAM